jgi:hypothetical protein
MKTLAMINVLAAVFFCSLIVTVCMIDRFGYYIGMLIGCTSALIFGRFGRIVVDNTIKSLEGNKK